MRFKFRKIYKFVLVGFVLLYLSFSPLISGSGSSEIEQRRKTFEVNETFDLDSTQSLVYQFPLWLDWVGTHAQVIVQGGVITGRTPTSLGIKVVLDGVSSQQTFEQKHGLQQHYTFHSTSEYVLWVQPPNHSTLKGIQTLHNFTVEITFNFNLTPQGTGIIHQVIFDTFTPPFLEPSNPSPIISLQNHFSWSISPFSFGKYFFKTPLIMQLSQQQNMTLAATVEFSGLELDRWELYIEHGATELYIRDQSTLEGSLNLDPTLPCELVIVVDPPSVSEPQTVSVSLQVQGVLLLSEEPTTSNTSDLFLNRNIVETGMLLQLGVVCVPILLYYRTRFISRKLSLEDTK
ncbi:MAG: hypothetical protein ACFFCZ_22265 [Promethearchaeota archaeon]